MLGSRATESHSPSNPDALLTQDTLLEVQSRLTSLSLPDPKFSPKGLSRCPSPGDPGRGPDPDAWYLGLSREAPSSQGSSPALRASSSGPEVGLSEVLPPTASHPPRTSQSLEALSAGFWPRPLNTTHRCLGPRGRPGGWAGHRVRHQVRTRYTWGVATPNIRENLAFP